MIASTRLPEGVFEKLELRPVTHVDRTARDEKAWYAIRVRSKFESIASASVRGKGYEQFLPLYRSRRQWSDRAKELDLPLFPGYFFCRFDANARLLPILTSPGVVSIVGAGKVPISIADEEITAIQTVITSGLAALPWPFLNVGARVYIERGPLTGIEGIVAVVNKKHRFFISVPLLQRSVMVEIDRAWVRPVPTRKGPHTQLSTGTGPRALGSSAK